MTLRQRHRITGYHLESDDRDLCIHCRCCDSFQSRSLQYFALQGNTNSPYMSPSHGQEQHMECAILHFVTVRFFCRWSCVNNMDWHTSPVLSLASLKLPQHNAAKLSQPSHLLVSGATDGSLAVWHLQLHDSATAPNEAAAEVKATRLLSMPRLHQSGVNAASMACVGSSMGRSIFHLDSTRLEPLLICW